MKSFYNIDIIIDKTFEVYAESAEEAKEIALRRASNLSDSYNSLTVDFVGKVDDNYDNEYETICFSEGGCFGVNYKVKAHTAYEAACLVEDMFKAEHPDTELETIRVLDGDVMFYDYNVVEEV